MLKNTRQIFSVAKSEFISWITNPRIIILGALLIFIKGLAIDPLAARVERFGETLVIFEPFISVGNSQMLLMLIPFSFLILLSDYPRLGGNTLFFISRIGKRNWLWGQFLFLLAAIFAFLTFILLSSFVFSGGRFDTSWSDAVTKYNARFPNEAFNFDSLLLPSNIYNQISMVRAVAETFILLSAYLFVLSLIIYLFKILFNNGTVGLAAALTIILLGLITTALATETKWAFPMANAVIWLHYDEILSRQIYPMWGSYLYFGVLITALGALNFPAVRKLRFTEN